MGSLASYLQHQFVQHCPPEWRCQIESRLLSHDLEQMLGYSSRVDVLLERTDASRRLWIEFEVSRADPVANHAKFAVAHLFQPQLYTDTFVSMVSPHVDRGRSHLAAHTIVLLRQLGMQAFQTVLLPQMTGAEIKRLNQIEQRDLAHEPLAVQDEIERVFTITEPVIRTEDHRIHFAANLLDVLGNVRRWNHDMATSAGRAAWGKRSITYFVCDPWSHLFAPAKFCAYVVIRPVTEGQTLHMVPQERAEMTLALYQTLKTAAEPLFDGHRAQTHLVKHLAMTRHRAVELPDVAILFHQWADRHADSMTLHPNGPILLIPPAWFEWKRSRRV